jgi:hypothetical protein
MAGRERYPDLTAQVRDLQEQVRRLWQKTGKPGDDCAFIKYNRENVGCPGGPASVSIQTIASSPGFILKAAQDAHATQAMKVEASTIIDAPVEGIAVSVEADSGRATGGSFSATSEDGVAVGVSVSVGGSQSIGIQVTNAKDGVAVFGTTGKNFSCQNGETGMQIVNPSGYGLAISGSPNKMIVCTGASSNFEVSGSGAFVDEIALASTDVTDYLSRQVEQLSSVVSNLADCCSSMRPVMASLPPNDLPV